MYYIYFNGESDKRTVTFFYMNIIEKAILKAGEKYVEVFDCPTDLKEDDVVVTLSCLTFFKAYRKFPTKTISWFQGISPEEYWLKDWNIFKRISAWLTLSFFESFVLRHCDLNLFVSERMLHHYQKKYHYKGSNYVIMPCVNEGELYKDNLSDHKYSSPTFLYSGNINEWQCFDEMLVLFKQIKSKIKDAILYVYTDKQQIAHEKLKQYGVEAIVDYKPQAELAEAIKGIKYGFIIRKDIAVNNVASPTKLSTYLSNGIIPIFSKCIGDYDKQIGVLRYSVPLGNNYEGLEKLYDIENSEIKAEDVIKDYSMVYSHYYNMENYVDIISQSIKNRVQCK